MGRQKAVIKARREAKRVLRRDSRSHKQREEESVTSLVQMGGVEAIGMARDSRDTSPILARNEAQLHYLKAIENKAADIRHGRSRVREKPGSAQQKRQRP
ncbi:phosphate starvation-inducible protein [Escherichia coli]|uniref:Phosphate starvation-inducible protein n=1 Tax=Escherichia coli TaxID=562 RepID=A0A376KWK9_ECOLX|nr:phosphate starvation-inducible protein [Escherichia coli]